MRTIAVSPSPQQSVKRNGLAARTSLTDSQKWLASRLQTFARIFGLHADPKGGHFAPARINDTLTLLFDDEEFESHHYAFHVSDAEFDVIFGRIREAKLADGSAPWSLDDGKLNDWNGGRGVYFRDPDGHVLELMTAQ